MRGAVGGRRLGAMDAATALARLGGVGGTRDVVRLSSRRRLRTAVARGRVVRLSRGRYALPGAERALVAAGTLHAVVSHLSAAQHWGWEVAYVPDVVHVSVDAGRHLAAGRPDGVVVHWTTLAGDDTVGSVTSPVRTVLDCARVLPFPEALAVADSALRYGVIDGDQLVRAAEELRGPGAARARRVAAYADGRAANPFESVLRGIVTEEGLDVLPQYAVDVAGQVIHPDLADPLRGVAIEADSWGSHAGRRQHDRDCARYNALVVSGWLVLRFTWEHVMLSPAYVRWAVRSLLGQDGPAGPGVRRDTPDAAA